MGAKKIFAIFACATAAILGVSFAIFPFCEHKINWDVVAGKTASIAAGANCPEIAADLVKSIKYGQFAAKANARIALFHNKKFGEIGAKNFIRSCGKNFDFEEYEARLMLEGIAKEPDFASGFFKMKYMPQIRALKNPYLKAVLYYSLSLRTKNPDSEKYAKTAFGILKAQPRCENKQQAFIEIAQMAFEKKRYADIVGAARLCPGGANYYAAFFGFLKDAEFYEYSRKAEEDYWCKRVFSYRQRLKRTKDPLNSGDALRYTALRLDYNWITNNYRDFNIPTLAYISHVFGDAKSLAFYKQYALSAENIKRNLGSEFGYLNAAATYFAAMGDFEASYEILNMVKDPHKKLKMLNGIVPNLKGGRQAIADFANYLKSAK